MLLLVLMHLPCPYAEGQQFLKEYPSVDKEMRRRRRRRRGIEETQKGGRSLKCSHGVINYLITR